MMLTHLKKVMSSARAWPRPAIFACLAAGAALAQPVSSPSTLDYWIGNGTVRPETLRVEAVKETYAQDAELDIKHLGTVTSFAVSGHAELTSRSSLVRIVLVDTNSDEYLVYEGYPLAESSQSFDFGNACRETCVGQGISVAVLKIETIDASLRIDSLTSAASSASNQPSLRRNGPTDAQVRNLQNLEIIERLNANIRKTGLRWSAGETSISSLSYAEKKRLLGQGKGATLPNLQGFDYYVGGIFELEPPGGTQSVYPADASALVEDFDWRSRHGADDPESPYYDGDPTGSGWITSVKRQLCGDCWAHCAVGAVEAQANLYFNQHLDLDLSEQHMVSCAGCGTCSGGNPGCTLRYIRDASVIDEACFPETGTDEPCTNQCSVPDERIRIGNYYYVGSREDEDLKRWLIDYGPITFGISSWWHCMLLVGYQTDTDLSTIWVVKNSWGDSWGEYGYGYLKVPSDDRYLLYAAEDPVFSDVKTYDIACYDHDKDGYANWGIGDQMPASCSAASTEKDCDDSDPGLGPFEADGSCRRIDGPPETTVRIEAEDMQLNGFSIEMLEFASDGALINLKGPAVDGSATMAFPGSSGQYDVFVVYHDENDGEALMSVSIAGITVDSWTLDELIPGGQQPQESNRLSRQVAADYTVNNGDDVRIDGLQDLWDNANVDYIEFVLREEPKTLRIEAEDMQLDTYRVEALDFASNGALINLKGPGLNGSATTAFPGNSGQYDIFVVYHDENDGEAQLTVTIAGVSVDSWILDFRSSEAQPEEANRLTRQIAQGYTVNDGDEIRIDGLQGNWDHANVDYIEFVIVQPDVTVRMEAEEMQLDTYAIEALDFASSGALINLKGPGTLGSATASFPGLDGRYNISVVYHDENDGLAQLSVSIHGALVDSWTLDFKSTEAQPRPANRLTRDIATGYPVNNGDEIRIDGLQGNWDNANVDYIEFVGVP